MNLTVWLSNSGHFWKTITKRKAKQQGFSAGVEFDGVKARDPDRIRDGWANYFERLYYIPLILNGMIW